MSLWALDNHREHLSKRYGFESLLGETDGMIDVFEQIRKVACQDVSVMILGETGTGKEVIARTLHQLSGRAGHSYKPINCAAIPDSLFDSELFGYEKGAFTGAMDTRRGLFEKAHKGTLFLDEIAEMVLPCQSRMLRVLQERSVRRVGGGNIDVDVRIISASNRDMEQMVEDGSFRRDLYYRLMVYPIRIPPLRERLQDIPLLCEYFIRKYSHNHTDPVVVESSVIDWMMEQTWLGNVRELENTIQFALVSSEGSPIRLENLPPWATGRRYGSTSSPEIASIQQHRNSKEIPVNQSQPKAMSLEEMEKQAIREALQDAEGNVSAAARRLGLGRTTMYRKMSTYGMHGKSSARKLCSASSHNLH